MVTVVIVIALFLVAAITATEMKSKGYVLHLRAAVGALLVTLLLVHQQAKGWQIVISFLVMLAVFIAGTFVGLVFQSRRQLSSENNSNKP